MTHHFNGLALSKTDSSWFKLYGVSHRYQVSIGQDQFHIYLYAVVDDFGDLVKVPR